MSRDPNLGHEAILSDLHVDFTTFMYVLFHLKCYSRYKATGTVWVVTQTAEKHLVVDTTPQTDGWKDVVST